MSTIRVVDWNTDLPQLRSLLGPGDRSGLEGRRMAAAENDAFVLVSEVDGEVVGVAVVHTNYRPQLGWHAQAGTISFQRGANAYLENIAVRRDWRGRGLGSQLLQAVEQEAARRGKTCLWCHTGEENLKAQQFYGRNGWEHVETMQPPWKEPGRLSRVYCKRVRL